ncbi:MAG: LamG domain-containing protein [Balneolaceae bacterium]|nr:MAG: LamG domain-containing protein [Balneolaceae bacterium]
MMKYLTLAITVLMLVAVFISCTDDFQEMDTRLIDREITFKLTDPESGETLVNVFEKAFRAEHNVQVEIESDYRINKVDVVNVNTRQVIENIAVNGNTATFSSPVANMGIPFGQAINLAFHLYFDDEGVDGFNYPSMRSFTLRVIDDIPSNVHYSFSDGRIQELATNIVNAARVYDHPEFGIVTSFKGGENSFMVVESNPMLNFGASRDFSVSWWMKTDHNISDPAVMGTQNWASGANTGWVVAYNRGRMRFVASSREEETRNETPYMDAGRFDVRNEESPWLDGEFHHMTITAKRGEGMYIYFNGVEEGFGTMASVNLDNGNPIHINQDGTGNYGDKLQAEYAKIVFYDRALTAEEVAEIYNNR